jgi:uncharacterized protein
MIALDTNILITLLRVDAPAHATALKAYHEAGGDRATWALPWPCVHEFLAIATHPRIFRPPTPLDQVIAAIAAWRSRRNVRFLAEDDDYWEVISSVLRTASVIGPQVHDARVAALCLHHNVYELWTADRDFSRFPKLRTRNPLV